MSVTAGGDGGGAGTRAPGTAPDGGTGRGDPEGSGKGCGRTLPVDAHAEVIAARARMSAALRFLQSCIVCHNLSG